MHLRIYLWLSCVVLAGYVRATEDAAAEKPTEETVVQIQNDVHSPQDPDLFIDNADDGSGLDTDESSGSGWGAGPGPDDEDGRGSATTRIRQEGTSEEGRGAGEEQPSRPETDISISGEDLVPPVEPSGSNVNQDTRAPDKVVIMNAKPEDRATSFFAQPGILAAVIGGAVVGLLCAILVVMFIVYRMRKKDEGSYALDEPKRSPAAASYGKGHNNREFYA
ncbi:syndecan isoform X4 [Helicoverpa armigera]|uniref:syndecan isoform X4 n=1 Tax=Helicoverpa armigera TaxID=29058 RepID=UPI002112BCE4|nr:syndecan isoform X4 [Helicoverpa armigera]